MSDIYQFITITYNHANLIEEHLESIKLQILNFGVDKIVQLTVIDDCSKDGNSDVISNWIESNKNFFWKTNLIVNETNIGIKSNYLKAIKEIVTPKYKLLGGDDLYIESSDVFNFMDYCSLQDSVFSPHLVQGRKTLGQSLYLYRLSYYKEHPNFIKLLLKDFNLFNAPGSYVNPKILSSAEYNRYLESSVEFFEDWPTWRFLFIEKQFTIDFYSKYIVDYRPSSDRISEYNSYKKIRVLSKNIATHFKIRFFYNYGWIFLLSDFHAISMYILRRKVSDLK